MTNYETYFTMPAKYINMMIADGIIDPQLIQAKHIKNLTAAQLRELQLTQDQLIAIAHKDTLVNILEVLNPESLSKLLAKFGIDGRHSAVEELLKGRKIAVSVQDSKLWITSCFDNQRPNTLKCLLRNPLAEFDDHAIKLITERQNTTATIDHICEEFLLSRANHAAKEQLEQMRIERDQAIQERDAIQEKYARLHEMFVKI